MAMFVYIVKGVAVVTLVSLWGLRGPNKAEAAKSAADRRNKLLDWKGKEPTADDKELAKLAEQERQRQRGQ